MAARDHEKRIVQLEQEVEALRRKVNGLEEAKPWWERIAGTFEKDPIYAKAMKHGREYRESLRPQKASDTSFPPEERNRPAN